MMLDATDRRIIEATQAGLPLAPAPHAEIGALDFVSHCYLRPRALPDWPYNLFAMVHGGDRAEVERKRALIADLLGPCCHRSDILYSTRILKKTGLRLKQEKG
jgi:DNA-binding Lrp family transcriptional regulator